MLLILGRINKYMYAIPFSTPMLRSGSCMEETTTPIESNLSPSVTVVCQISDLLDRGVTEIPPLAESIDPDAVDRIFTGSTDGDPVVTFTHAGCEVEITASEITVARR